MRRLVGLLVLVTLAAGVGACSDSKRSGEANASSSAAPAPRSRPTGPKADLSAVLSGGNGVFLPGTTASAAPPGTVEEERVAAGTASSYRAVTPLGADGRFDLAPDATAAYRTRIVVRRPSDPARFNGTVVVEWLNVSGGIDAAPDASNIGDELARGGYAWVGVSAQLIGVEGGPVAVPVAAAGDLQGKGLRNIDPARYGGLQHPGDAFAYDIFTQVARALRAGDGLGGLTPARLLAVGDSQSAFMLVTYADGVQPLTDAFDAFLLHSRGAGAAPLGEQGKGIDVIASFSGAPTRIRDDLKVPVLILETETDVLAPLGYLNAIQDDTDHLRVWEMAGTAHADRFLVGAAAGAIDCGGAINAGPQHFIESSALRSLDQWVRTGVAPPHADRFAIEGTPPEYRRDADGIVVGGIRTPLVDVPVDVLSGQSRPTAQLICLLFGSTTPLPAERIAQRYATRAAYLASFAAATDAAIAAGFVLPEDRAAMLATAQPDRVSP